MDNNEVTNEVTFVHGKNLTKGTLTFVDGVRGIVVHDPNMTTDDPRGFHSIVNLTTFDVQDIVEDELYPLFKGTFLLSSV